MSATSYVNNNQDLADALKRMQDDPNSTEAKYWKGRTGGKLTADAFGKAHADETNALITGDYQDKHGAGSTDITPGTKTDFAKENLPKLKEANVESPKVKERENNENEGKISSGAGVVTPPRTDPDFYPTLGGGLLDTSGEAATADTGLLSGTGLPYNRANLPVWSGTGSILGTQKLWDATQTARARAEALSGNYRALDAMWKDAQARRASLAGDPNAQELQSAIMRAAGDQIRIIQGREMGLEGPKPKGLGTPWVGPGLRVALDSEGNVERDDQGRVVYDYDPEAYRGRFYEKYTPTSAEVEHWRNLFPDSPYDITEGYVTPWQQVNAQWMTGSKNEKGKLLSDLGITPTDEQIGLFDKSLKEGVVPQAWRDAWRTEKWGDIWNDQTKMWEPAPPDQREAALQEQQERYEKGYFNPTTGKGGAGEGAVSQWGVGTGLISPKDFVPLDWTGSQPVPSMGITGTPTGIFAPGGGGVGGLINQGAYRQPAPQDWSNIMPVSTPLASQQALVSGQGKFYQPWATGQGVPPGLLNYQIPGGPAANLTYSGAQPSLFDPITTNGNGNGNGTDEVQLQDWQQPGFDYSGTYGPKGQPTYVQSWPSSIDWYRGLYGGDPDFVNPFVTNIEK
tara:strand:+ start:1458 stop:3329 length:1872 start_codon:yes stop_codon:yes gene_type:complete